MRKPRSRFRAGWVAVAIVTGLLALHCSSDGNGPGGGDPPAPTGGGTGTVRLVVRGVP